MCFQHMYARMVCLHDTRIGVGRLSGSMQVDKNKIWRLLTLEIQNVAYRIVSHQYLCIPYYYQCIR